MGRLSSGLLLLEELDLELELLLFGVGKELDSADLLEGFDVIASYDLPHDPDDIAGKALDFVLPAAQAADHRQRTCARLAS